MSPIPTAPHGPSTGGGGYPGGGTGGSPAPSPSSSGSYSGSGTSSSSSGGTSGGSSSGSGGGGGPSEYERKAAQRYREQARHLEAQARALRHALNIDFKKALKQQLGDVGEVLHAQQQLLMSGYRDRVQSLAGAAHDNNKAEAQQTGINQTNLTRERASALGEAMSQGAGESDILQTQLMSLRNWQANQSEISRGFYDTLRSVNSSLTDLNVDTATARVNNAIQANADREQLWTDYYNRRSEAWTNLGNTYGQQADYLSMAHEMAGGGSGGGKANQAAHAFMQGALDAGRSWDNPGISNKLLRWDGRRNFKAKPTNASEFRNVQNVNLGERPEGATLREW